MRTITDVGFHSYNPKPSTDDAKLIPPTKQIDDAIIAEKVFIMMCCVSVVGTD